MLIEGLPWDSDFFGLKVGVIRSGTFDLSAFESERDAFDLIYIYEKPDDSRNTVLATICGNPADTRVTYIKQLTNSLPVKEGVVNYMYRQPDKQLIALALESGIYSRFYTDKRFPPDAYERLYKEWILRSVDKSLACSVLVYYNESGFLDGFVTLEIKGPGIQIGLIAVDARARGQGIGARLVRAAEWEAHHQNFLYLKVSTQSANRTACRLYEKCGYAVEDVEHIYHYWKK